ncbi:MAG: acyltransferase [Pseudomonas sp.]
MAKDIRALTGVRGVAASIIVLYHFGDVHLFDGGRLLYYPIPYGYLPVDLFFMLSGYVIGLTYGDKLTAGHLNDFGFFLLKRVARLYPAYLAIAILYVAKIAAGLSGPDSLTMFSSYDVIGNLLMLTGWGLHVRPLMGVSWAASAEMGSYLLAPLLLLLTVKRNKLVCGLVALAALVGVYAVSASGYGASGPLDVVSGDSFYPLLRAVAGFTLGLAIFRYAGMLDPFSVMAQDVTLLIVLAAIIIAAVAGAGDLTLYVLFVPLVAVLSRDGRLAQMMFGNALVYRLGIISYSVYLLHPLFVSFAVSGWREFGRTGTAYVIASIACFAGIWLLSEMSYRLVEMPGRKAVVDFVSRFRRS